MAESPVASPASSVRRLDTQTVVAWTAYLALWFVAFRQLSLEWSVNTLYAYGWSIPVLAGYLAWERWPHRPPVQPGRIPAWLWVLPAAAVLAYVPLRLIAEANPDWLLLNWAMTSLAVGLTLLGLFRAGGWAWVRHFGFPVLFTFTAVAWPVSIENFILQNLMSSNAAVTADLLTLCGLPAMAMGNVIAIGEHTVGVEEACSGIRSLQTAFMMSLFMGEYFRLSPGRRLALVASSFGLAYILNLARTIVLTYVGGTDGPAALEAWHDPLGYAVLGLCLAGLIGLGFWMEKRGQAQAAGESADAAEGTVVKRGKSRPVFVPNRPAGEPAPGVLPLAWSAALLLILVGAEVGTVQWFRAREQALPPAVDWSIAFPESAKKFTRYPFAERTRTILKFNEGDSATWFAPNGDFWTTYYLRWLPGRVAQNLAGAHTPDICLPASGLRLLTTEGTTVVEVRGLKLPFRRYIFDSGGQRMYVFHCILDDRPGSAEEALVAAEPLSRESRLRNTWQGRRNLGQRVVGISVSGPASLAAAERTLQTQLLSLIRTP